MSVLVSIIIPIYNGEQYLDACMGAIMGMTYKNWECILVNDGSTDATKDRCDDYARKDKRIKTIHTQNQGPGCARNTGLEAATGTYVFFADVDDTIEKDGVSKLVALAMQYHADIVAGLYYRIGPKKKELVGKKLTQGKVSRDGARAFKRYHRIKSSSLFGYLWNKLYRRDFLLRHQLLFDDARSLMLEDTLFNLKAFGKAPVYYLCTTPVYCYNAQNISYSRRAEPRIVEKSIALIKTYKDYLDTNLVFEENMDLAAALSARLFCWTMVKNVPYEGVSYKKYCQIIGRFLEDKSFRSIVTHKTCIRKLLTLRSIPQRIFYISCFLLLRKNFKRTLAFLMMILYPFQKLYIAISLK